MKISEVSNLTYIEETSQIFQALALRHIMLQEGRLDEAGIWDAVKGTVGGVMRGVKSADDAINKLGRLAQQTKPVEAFDSKVDEIVANIKQKLGTKAPKAVAAAESYAAWAKKNPIKQGLIIGALTAVAALASGPGAAAAAGFILRSANEYMKGEKASTAIGKGVKTAAIGAITANVAHAISGPVAELFKGWRIQNIPIPEMPEFIKKSFTIDGNRKMVTMLKSDQQVLDNIWKKIEDLRGAAANATSEAGKYNALGKIEMEMWNLRNAMFDFRSQDYADKMLKIAKDANFVRKAIVDNDVTVKIIDAVAKTFEATMQGAASSGLGGKAAGAVAGAAKKGAGAVKGAASAAADKYRQFVPSNTYKQANQQIATLPPADRQKLIAYLQQQVNQSATV